MIRLDGKRRLIDADDLIETLLDGRRTETETIPKLIRLIEAQPTVEPKRGRWIDIDDEFMSLKCSECELMVTELDYDYCPFCGARMEVGE